MAKAVDYYRLHLESIIIDRLRFQKGDAAIGLCPQCRKAMEERDVLRANTYGTIRVERGIAKKDGIRVAVCPSCGMLVFRMERR